MPSVDIAELPCVKVKKADGADLVTAFSAYQNQRILHLPRGTYTITEPLEIPDYDSDRVIVLQGEGQRVTKIVGSAGCADVGVIECKQDSWQETLLVLKDLSVEGSGNEKYTCNLPFIKLHTERVRLGGALRTHVAAESEEILHQGGAGSSGEPSILNHLTLTQDSEVTKLAYLWDEALFSNSLALVQNGTLTDALYLLGTCHRFSHINFFIGNAQSCSGNIVRTNSCMVSIGSLWAIHTGTPTLYPSVFDIDTSSHCSVQDIHISAGFLAKLWKDADSQIQTNILGTINDKNLFQVHAAVTDGATVAHGLGVEPHGVVVTGTVAGEIVTVTAKDATNITVAIKTHAGAAGTSQTIYARYKL